MKNQSELFRSSLVPGKPGSGRLFDEELFAVIFEQTGGDENFARFEAKAISTRPHKR